MLGHLEGTLDGKASMDQEDSKGQGYSEPADALQDHVSAPLESNDCDRVEVAMVATVRRWRYWRTESSSAAAEDILGRAQQEVLGAHLGQEVAAVASTGVGMVRSRSRRRSSAEHHKQGP